MKEVRVLKYLKILPGGHLFWICLSCYDVCVGVQLFGVRGALTESETKLKYTTFPKLGYAPHAVLEYA